jgi:hypothetical protein
MSEQTPLTPQPNWLQDELKNNTTPNTDFEKLETLKLEDGKIVTFSIDFAEPFKKWTKTENGKTTIKAIIPVTHKGIKKNLWLNVKNPLYNELCQLGSKGQKEFKVSTTGTQNSTRYKIVTED